MKTDKSSKCFRSLMSCMEAYHEQVYLKANAYIISPFHFIDLILLIWFDLFDLIFIKI